MKFPCLVLDHDDTVVRSEETVNYPQFCQTLAELRPGVTVSRETFTRDCLQGGYAFMCRQRYGFTDDELAYAFAQWKVYVRTHVPPAYEGIRALLTEHKARGGLIFVVSHSADENILRDYRLHVGMIPDGIYSWDLPEALRKPSPYSLQDIMKKTGYAPRQLLMVDDLRQGRDMAAACGVPFACAGWSHYLPDVEAAMRRLCSRYFSTVQALYDYLFDS